MALVLFISSSFNEGGEEAEAGEPCYDMIR